MDFPFHCIAPFTDPAFSSRMDRLLFFSKISKGLPVEMGGRPKTSCAPILIFDRKFETDTQRWFEQMPDSYKSGVDEPDTPIPAMGNYTPRYIAAESLISFAWAIQFRTPDELPWARFWAQSLIRDLIDDFVVESPRMKSRCIEWGCDFGVFSRLMSNPWAATDELHSDVRLFLDLERAATANPLSSQASLHEACPAGDIREVLKHYEQIVSYPTFKNFSRRPLTKLINAANQYKDEALRSAVVAKLKALQMKLSE